MSAELIKRLVALGISTEDLQAILDGWAKPVPKAEPSAGALRQRAYMERKRAREGAENVASLSVTDDVSVTQKERSPIPPKEKLSKTLPTEEQKEGEVVSIFPDAQDLELALDAYRQVAELRGLPLVRKITEARRRKLKQRLRDAGSLEGWYEVCDKLKGSTFLQDIRADLDFMLQEKSFIRLMEGKYDNGKKSSEVFRAGSGATF